MTTYRQVPVSDLTIDARYQRPLDLKRVDKLVTEFDPRQLGVLEVSKRNGKAAVFDGQHRLAALRKLKAEKAPCLVHDDLLPQHEADLFVRLQRDRRPVQPLERFHAAVFAGDETALDIAAIARACGYTIGRGDEAGGHAIRAVVALERIHGRYGNLADVLQFVRRVWADDPRSVDGWFLQAVGQFLAEYGDRVKEVAEARLAELSPVQIIRRADTKGIGRGEGHKKWIAKTLRQVAGVRGRPRKASA